MKFSTHFIFDINARNNYGKTSVFLQWQYGFQASAKHSVFMHMYFSNILQILLEELMWFNIYNSLNYTVDWSILHLISFLRATAYML